MSRPNRPRRGTCTACLAANRMDAMADTDPIQQATPDSDIHLEGVTKRFAETTGGRRPDALDRAWLVLRLLGPSGCGKTTTLRMIGGFEDPTDGRVFLGGEDVTEQPPYRRDVNTVFQSYALFPHLTSSATSRSASSARRSARPRSARASARPSSSCSSPAWATASPPQLSGGQQQRVALARALVNRPRALLLDEPLGALDLRLRRQLQIELKRIQQEVGITFVHVTHDQEEAHDDGRHDRRDERRPDRAGRLRRGALRAPAHGVRRELPRAVQPDRRQRRRPRRRTDASRPTTASTLQCPAIASATHGPARCGSACAPRRSRCVARRRPRVVGRPQRARAVA